MVYKNPIVEINDERKNRMQPGPDAYTPQASLNSTGHYFNSKWKNSCARVISPSSGGRFNPKAYSKSLFGLAIVIKLICEMF